jgi:hypothetical protein
MGNEMTFPHLQPRVRCAIDLLYEYDHELFSRKNKVSEWAIAHRLAVYLEQLIPKWHVDCEYDKQGENFDPKTNAETDGKTERTRPDIVIHHRRQLLLEHNLLIVELKKEEDPADWKKAKEFTAPPKGNRKFQYQYGLALSLVPKCDAHWFQKGVQID